MNAQEFCYWLQGVFEIGHLDKLDEEQVAIIKDHLKLVFTKVTPDRTPPSPAFTPSVWPSDPYLPSGGVAPLKITCGSDGFQVAGSTVFC